MASSSRENRTHLYNGPTTETTPGVIHKDLVTPMDP